MVFVKKSATRRSSAIPSPEGPLLELSVIVSTGCYVYNWSVISSSLWGACCLHIPVWLRFSLPLTRPSGLDIHTLLFRDSISPYPACFTSPSQDTEPPPFDRTPSPKEKTWFSPPLFPFSCLNATHYSWHLSHISSRVSNASKGWHEAPRTNASRSVFMMKENSSNLIKELD